MPPKKKMSIVLWYHSKIIHEKLIIEELPQVVIMREVGSNCCKEVLLCKLMKCYYRGSLDFNLEHEDIKLMSWEWQQKLLDTTINSPQAQQFPTSCQFSRLFIKRIISYLEGNQEVHDDFYSLLCALMNQKTIDDDFSYRHYLIDNESKTIIIKETNKMVVNGTTGMRTWEAALMLADWALCNKDLFSNKTVLELGSGVGFTGVTIGKLCSPKSVYMTDFHQTVLNTITENIKINFPEYEENYNDNFSLFNCKGNTVCSMRLDWLNLDDVPCNLVPDVLIGADVVYDPSILSPLCEVIKLFLSKNINLDIFIASVIRNEETFEEFLKHLGKMQLGYRKILFPKSVHIEWDHSITKCLLQINYIQNEL